MLVTFLNLLIYFIGAIFFVINSKKCFLEKLTIPKAILTFLLSPSVGSVVSYLIMIMMVLFTRIEL